MNKGTVMSQFLKALTINNVKKLVMGVGEIKRLAACCHELGITHTVMIVTDSGLAKMELHKPLLEVLTKANIKPVVFSEVAADPSESILTNAIEQALSHNIQGVIGFGGGSSLDVAKMVSLLGHYDATDTMPECYGVDKVKGERLPLLQIPTTMGTGSEVTPVAIITTGETTKNACVSPKILADTVILDAEFTRDLPSHIAAATGIDAMVHALEAFTSIHKRNPVSDGLAKQALQLLNENILQATTLTAENPARLMAREKMLLGATLAGQAFAIAPVAAVHALAYPLGGHFHVPHGNSNALVLTQVMRFNLRDTQQEYAELALLLLPEIAGSPEDVQAQALITHFDSLIKKLGVPAKLRDYQITASALDTLADDAMLQTRLLQNNPRPVTRQDALAIYEAIL